MHHLKILVLRVKTQHKKDSYHASDEQIFHRPNIFLYLPAYYCI
jgi:hypothetical protein